MHKDHPGRRLVRKPVFGVSHLERQFQAFDRFRSQLVVVLLSLLTIGAPARAEIPIERELIHLRLGEEREWATFPEVAQGNRLERSFNSTANPVEWTLQLRQQDVRRNWRVVLNGTALGRLEIDECDRLFSLPVPAGQVHDGENELVIEPVAGTRGNDDIRVGELILYRQPVVELVNQGTVEVKVHDHDSGTPLPSRITVVNEHGTLQQTGAVTGEELAVRTGTIFTSTGKARIGVPPGEYTIYAGRGFEYSLARCEVSVNAGDVLSRELTIRREVPTEGYVACDTHVHTLTHSGHGDATILERMITLAAEGIELPVATDHNVQIDHQPFAMTARVRGYFTPVIGNEVTTPVGHFNIFPVFPGVPVPDHRSTDWEEIYHRIVVTPGVQAVILNHARDLHGGVRPFGTKLFNPVVGERLDGAPILFNAMEVVNSGATQSDPMRLFHDWMGLLNRGYRITPVGSSDSHDVARHFVGQGRTYIRVDDSTPAFIDVQQASRNFVAGQVLVSYGLLAELTVDGQYRSGETASITGETVELSLRVLGPHWVEADRIQLFANGQLIRDEKITHSESPSEPSTDRTPLPAGHKWTATWTIPRPRHDVHLVAIASGPGIDGPYWKTAKPYQPTSIHWEPRVLGCSGAVLLDVDDDGTFTSPRAHAELLVEQAAGNLDRLETLLSGFDAAVAAQAAHLFVTQGGATDSPEYGRLLRSENDDVRMGFQSYANAWRESEIARLQD